MNTILFHVSDSRWLIEALDVIRTGGLVAFPTDTVYGLGTSAFNALAVQKIYAAKERPDEKTIPILLGDIADLEKVSSNVPRSARILALHFWPGPLTIVVPKEPGIPEAVSRSTTIGVRIPEHPVAERLLRAAGPMAVTSANLSGMQNPLTAREVLDQLHGRIDMIIDGGGSGLSIPSTVVNCMGAAPEILREGPISLQQILEVLNQ
ncbi:MAG TPA: L-threonylcarbamoyladenylate synthase [Anaerolineales bacterium]|nr:L-threonylcarbamoyladenylate synthase [Anaerolineales bacterium]